MKLSIVLSLLPGLVSLLANVEAHSWVHCVDFDVKTGLCHGLPLWQNGVQIESSELVQDCAFNPTKAGCNQVCGQMTEFPTTYRKDVVKQVVAKVKRGGSVFMVWPTNAHIFFEGHPYNHDNRSFTNAVILKAPKGVKTGADGNTKPLSKWRKLSTMPFGTNCFTPKPDWAFSTEYGVTDPMGICGGKWKIPASAGCGRQMFAWMWMYTGGSYANHTQGATPLNYDANGPAYTTCFMVDIAC